MDNKLSELSKPVGYYRLSEDGVSYYLSSPTEKLDEEVVPLYSQEYVSALLAELEATRKQSQELAKQFGRLGARAAIAERKLATPVRLPNKSDDEFWFDGVFQVAKFDRAVERAISAAGFKFVGDE
ncbi:hypothetical protein [Serratia marcescens]|uniref:hypothetical protein n=1 Tax=Serratia marcescens TaxID=615 RepID=UPI000E57FB4A|nr:hypothetical protein [Serratia marcescens]AXX22106.1 hypothetical protein C7M66_24215 [Serratia marcescens]AXX25060.1 hypothetical protein C7M65_13795 [Serratia marcescens]RTE99043.1 hypothetical protein C7M70_11315 [Serratia marcescens]RTF15025.1 hypothetical protein C7M67_13985 [Serratia marcescens]RTF20190.1 hypothetical protein D9B81_22960 [Serratia marcescens]